MPDLTAYHRMRDEHRWSVPDSFNIASEVCDKHPADKLAMVWTDGRHPERSVQWGELQDLSARFATYFTDRGIARGDRIAVLLPTTPESVAAVLGALKVGAIAMPLSTLWSDDSLAYRIADAGATLLVTDDSGARRPLGEARDTLALGPETLDDVRSRHAGDTVATSPDDPALLYYTSGSTGPPKGVLAPHRSLIGHNEFEYCQDLREGERSYWMGDWAWGVYKILGPWYRGAVNVVLSTQGRFDAALLLETLSRLRVTNLFVNPTGLRLMMTAVPDAGTRFPQQFRVACCANEPLGTAEADWFEQQFGLPLLDCYGMTEAYPMIANLPGLPRKRGSMGLPVPGWDVAILDENENPVPPTETGEICLRARSNPQYPIGYWGRPEDSERDFGGDWFHTKDLAWADHDGYVFYVGRSDDVIKSAGYRISPFEVESVCMRHEAVRDAAVIGTPDPERGQRVKAFIVLHPGYPAGEDTAESVRRFVKREHSAFGYPKFIEFVDDLPRGQSGKILRAELRARSAHDNH